MKQCGRCKVLTKQTNSGQHINDEAQDVALEFMHNMMIVLPALGYNVLDPIVSSSTVAEKDNLYLNVGGLKAKGAEIAEGFAIFSGSKVSLNPSSSLLENAKKKRVYLFQEKIIQGDRFVKDYVFNSSSEAAAVVLGYAVSGPQTWHYKDGTTLKQANENAAVGTIRS